MPYSDARLLKTDNSLTSAESLQLLSSSVNFGRQSFPAFVFIHILCYFIFYLVLFLLEMQETAV